MIGQGKGASLDQDDGRRGAAERRQAGSARRPAIRTARRGGDGGARARNSPRTGSGAPAHGTARAARRRQAIGECELIYCVRWRSAQDEREYSSGHHLSTKEATDFACTVLDQMTVSDISIVDGSGHQVMRMPEITRYCQLKKTW
jgi:hypothetical protein